MKIISYKNIWLGNGKPVYKFGFKHKNRFRKRYFTLYFWYWVVVFEFNKLKPKEEK